MRRFRLWAAEASSGYEGHNRSSRCPRRRCCTKIRGRRHRIRCRRRSCTCLCIVPPCRSAGGGGAEQGRACAKDAVVSLAFRASAKLALISDPRSSQVKSRENYFPPKTTPTPAALVEISWKRACVLVFTGLGTTFSTVSWWLGAFFLGTACSGSQPFHTELGLCWP